MIVFLSFHDSLIALGSDFKRLEMQADQQPKAVAELFNDVLAIAADLSDVKNLKKSSPLRPVLRLFRSKRSAAITNTSSDDSATKDLLFHSCLLLNASVQLLMLHGTACCRQQNLDRISAS